MLYAINAEDNVDTLEQRLAARPAHVERLKKLQEQGRLVIAGPYPAIESDDPGQASFTGSLVVAQFDSLEEAQRWADDDPYIKAGVYKKVSIKPYKKVLP